MRDLSSVLGAAPWPGFPQAAEATLQVLHGRLGLDLWLVTKVLDADQIVVAAYPNALVPVGTVLSWEDGYCRRIVAGDGPRVASVVASVPAYAGLRYGQEPKIAAYLGVPLTRRDGSLCGTVCGFSTRAQPASLARHLPMVELVAGLLATLLATGDAAATTG
jgi:GAF domain-containing protein